MCPASTLIEAMDALRAPFPPGVEQYRAGPTWDKDGSRWTRPLAYVDARAVFARLDEAVGPDNWSTDLERLAQGVFLAKLTILGVTRADVGQAGENEGEKEKSGASDAIKRAAVAFGVGAYLYGRELAPVQLERRGNDWVLPRGYRPPTPQVTMAPPQTLPFRGGPTDRQRARIDAELRRLGWSADDLRPKIDATYNKPDIADLTGREASNLIERLAGTHIGAERAP